MKRDSITSCLSFPTIFYFTMSPSEVADYMHRLVLDLRTRLEAASINATSAERWLIRFTVISVRRFFSLFFAFC